LEFFGGKAGFEKRKENDKIKKNWIEKNKLNLIEITYLDMKNIEETEKRFADSINSIIKKLL
jgi:hypothetical protein